MALLALAGAALVSNVHAEKAESQTAASDSVSPTLAPRSSDLGGWRPVEAGRSSDISFESGRRARDRALRLADLGGSGFAAITAPVPARSSVTVRGAINVYRMRLSEGASRPLAWVGSVGGQSQQAGIIRVRGALRWAAWYLTPTGRRARLSVGKRPVVTRGWQKISLRTAWSGRRARTSLSIGGRTVTRTHPVDLRGIRANRVSIGLGRASRRGQSAIVLLRSAAVKLRSAPVGTAPVAVAPTPPIARLSAEVHPYSPSFAFNEPVPVGAATDPRSSAVVGQLADNASVSKVTLTTDGEVPPVYVASPSDPLLSVTVGGIRTRFRVPKQAVAGSGSDSPLVVLDPNHPDFGRQTELRLWQASIGSTSLSASGAGLFHYNSDGAAVNPDGSQSLGIPFAGYGTGSGLSILAGLIRGDEVRGGEIRHALRFTYSATDFSSRFRAPAVKSDQPNGTSTRNPATAMDMGMRLQLDRSVDCSARTVPGRDPAGSETRVLRMVCRALQDYGMIAVDGTGNTGLLFMAENEATADWGSIIGPQVSGSYGYLLRDETSPADGLIRSSTSGIPWSKLRVLAVSDF
jgi:hypothetical protein